MEHHCLQILLKTCKYVCICVVYWHTYEFAVKRVNVYDVIVSMTKLQYFNISHNVALLGEGRRCE